MNGWDALGVIVAAGVWGATLLWPRLARAWDRAVNSCWSCGKPAVHHPDGSYQTHCVSCPPRTVASRSASG